MSDSSRLPIATLILIVANLAASFLLVSQPDLIFDFGYNAAQPTLQSTFASLFMHANLLHLLGNMLFLAAVGAAVELATGSLRFVTVYFLSGLAGIGAHTLFAGKPHGDPIFLVGASGCIAGCAGYYGIRYMTLRVPLAPRLSVPVIAVIGMWLLLQVAGALKAIGDANASTAFSAHIGGLVAGLLLSLIFRAPDLGHRKLGHKVLDEMNQRGPAAAAAAALRHLELHPDDPKALQQLIEAHALMNDIDGEAGALIKIIDLLPDEEIGLPVKRVAAIKGLAKLPPLNRIKVAQRAAPHDREAARLLLESVLAEPHRETQRPEAMLALASLDWTEAPERAKPVLRKLQQEYPLHACVELARTRGWLS